MPIHKCLTVADLLNMGIGTRKIVVWVREPFEEKAEPFYLCVEGSGNLFLVPCKCPTTYDYLYECGTKKSQMRLYATNPGEET